MSLEIVNVGEYIVKITDSLQDQKDLKDLVGPYKGDYFHALIYQSGDEEYCTFGRTPSHRIFAEAIKQRFITEIILLLQAQIIPDELTGQIVHINFYQPEESAASCGTVSKELFVNGAQLLLESVKPSLLHPCGVIVDWDLHNLKKGYDWKIFYQPEQISEERSLVAAAIA